MGRPRKHHHELDPLARVIRNKPSSAELEKEMGPHLVKVTIKSELEDFYGLHFHRQPVEVTVTWKELFRFANIGFDKNVHALTTSRSVANVEEPIINSARLFEIGCVLVKIVTREEAQEHERKLKNSRTLHRLGLVVEEGAHGCENGDLSIISCSTVSMAPARAGPSTNSQFSPPGGMSPPPPPPATPAATTIYHFAASTSSGGGGGGGAGAGMERVAGHSCEGSAVAQGPCNGSNGGGGSSSSQRQRPSFESSRYPHLLIEQTPKQAATVISLRDPAAHTFLRDELASLGFQRANNNYAESEASQESQLQELDDDFSAKKQAFITTASLISNAHYEKFFNEIQAVRRFELNRQFRWQSKFPLTAAFLLGWAEKN